MKLTKAHRDFYCQKKVSFLGGLASKVCIHSLINSQVRKNRTNLEIGNTNNLLGSKMRRLGCLAGFVDLYRAYQNSQQGYRAAYLKRIARKLEKSLPDGVFSAALASNQY